MAEQKAQTYDDGEQNEGKAELIRREQGALAASCENEIQRKKAEGRENEICIVPHFMRHDEHRAYERAEQELEIQKHRAAAEPHDDARLRKPCGGRVNDPYGAHYQIK